MKFLKDNLLYDCGSHTRKFSFFLSSMRLQVGVLGLLAAAPNLVHMDILLLRLRKHSLSLIFLTRLPQAEYVGISNAYVYELELNANEDQYKSLRKVGDAIAKSMRSEK